MAIPFVKYTFTDAVANDVTAARLNAIGDAIEDAQQMPAVRVFHNAAQTLTTGVGAALAFNSERYDQFSGAADTQHDTVTNNTRLTCRYAGIYEIGCCVQFASNATGIRTVQLRANISSVATLIDEQDAISLSANVVTINLSTHYALAVNDYVEVVCAQNSGGNLNVNSVANLSPEFWMARIA